MITELACKLFYFFFSPHTDPDLITNLLLKIIKGIMFGEDIKQILFKNSSLNMQLQFITLQKQFYDKSIFRYGIIGFKFR